MPRGPADSDLAPDARRADACLDDPLRRAAYRALEAYPQLSDPWIEPLGSGLMHHTFAVHDASGERVLQQVHALLDPAIHHNIRAVTEHLRACDIPSPALVETGAGALFHTGEDGRVWRLLTRVPGHTLNRCPGPEHARSASELIAHVHTALSLLDHRYRPLGIVLHDTAEHLRALSRALARHGAHPLHGEAHRIATQIFEIAADWSSFDDLPRRPAHGDLKFNNVLFEVGSARAHALIDLDTLGPLPLFAELGDAWRSWCNRRPDDHGSAELDLDIWRASAASYLDACALELSEPEVASLAEGMERISLELAARFTADVLEESYFGWDRERFARAGEHQRMRALTQLDMYHRARATRAERLSFLAGA